MHKPDLLAVHRYSEEDMRALEQHYVLHVLSDSSRPDALVAGLIADIGPRIRGAALDVFWSEPSIDPAFAELDNVVLQPHRSSAPVETRTAMAGPVRDNQHAFCNSRPLLTESTR
jgi:lactate dehydrogenase-like 2-hydroxyacid dehydrogenase